MDAVSFAPLPLLLPVEPQYRCPGEAHTISRSVHLARLAAFFPKCRHCQHRHDTGQIAPSVVEQIQDVQRQRAPQRSLFQTDGVRGVFLNEITPAVAGRIAGSLASLFWEDVPLTAMTAAQRAKSPKRSGPLLVIGYDERPSSPALFAAVADSLRMMGCEVVDLGLVAQPCFRFAVDHLQAAGGVYVTGAGCDAAWSGLDLFAEGAAPLSLGSGLDAVQRRFEESYSRATRRAGFQRAFQALVPYEPSLWKHFHALRPLKIVSAVRPRVVRELLRRVFAKLPCELIEVETKAADNAPIRLPVLQTEVCRRVPKRGAHLGVIIDDDGSRCWFSDEKGKLISAERMTAFLAAQSLLSHPASTICLETDSTDSLRSQLKPDRTVEAGTTLGQMHSAMSSTNSVFGGGASDRYWWREAFPACDAILTLAHVLQGLSRSDAAFSKKLSDGS